MNEEAPDWYRWEGEDLILDVKVQPRASRDELSGVQNNRLKVRLTAPPVDGKANAHLLQYLGAVFKVPKSRIELLSGHSGRDKRLRIHAPSNLPAMIHRP